MKGYKKYKDSGIEWIGEIPQDWSLIKLKRLTQIKRGASPRPIEDVKYFDDEGEFSWVRIADVSASERYLYSTKEKLSELGASLSVKQFPGDLFLSIAGSVGKPIITKIKCCIHDGFVWFPDLKINPEYLFYIFSTGLPFNGLGKVGTQLNLNTESIGNIIIPNISSKQMESIVSYLDKKTALIDEIISKKERLIELLQAKRQATINEAVTGKKVWDATTQEWKTPKKVKHTGIEWLGEIPAEWEVVKLKYLVSKIGSGVTPKGGGEVYADDGVIFVRSQNVHFDGLRLDEVVRIDIETHENMSNSKVQFNDVLLNITGASIGRCCVVKINEEINVNQHVSILRTNNRILPEFLNLVLQSQIGQHQVNLKSSGGNREGLTAEAIKTFIIPLPELLDQDVMFDILNQQLLKFDKTIYKISSQIQKLKDYRQSLISEVVTGKIDVTDWSAK